MVALLLIAGASAQQSPMSREEKTVRAAYAKFAYAAQVREIERIISEHPDPLTIDRAEFAKRLRDAEVTFQLSDVRVGDIAEINTTM